MEVQLFHWNTKYPDYITASQNPDGLSAVSFFYECTLTDNPVIARQLEVLANMNLTNGAALYWNHGNQFYSEFHSEFYPEFYSEFHDNQIYFPEFEQPFPTTSLSQLLPDGGLEESDNYFHYKGSQTQPRVPMTFTPPNFSNQDHTVKVTIWNGTLCCDCQDTSKSEITVGTLTCACCNKPPSLASFSNQDQRVIGSIWNDTLCCDCQDPSQSEITVGTLTCLCCDKPPSLTSYSSQDHRVIGSIWNGTLCCDCQDTTQTEITVGTLTCVCCDKSSSPTDSSTDCTESVTWIVYEKKIAISEAQLNVYRGILSINSVSNYDQTSYVTSWLGIPCCNCNNPATIESHVACRCCEDLICSKNFRPLHPLNPTTRKLILYRPFFCKYSDQSYLKVKQPGQPEACFTGNILLLLPQPPPLQLQLLPQLLLLLLLLPPPQPPPPLPPPPPPPLLLLLLVR